MLTKTVGVFRIVLRRDPPVVSGLEVMVWDRGVNLFAGWLRYETID